MSLPKVKFELEFNQGSIYSDEERLAILRVFDNKAPSCGSEVLSFENEFAQFNNVLHALAVGNATQGLEIACRSVINSSNYTNKNVEIIVPSLSWISTASSAALAGATVKFADVLSPSVCINPDDIKRLVSPQTVAVVVVHLFGRPVDGLIELASWLHDRNIYLIEDCAHAIGATYSNGIKCGSIGDIGVFSFHQQKNMVTLGEGGMCITNNSNLYRLMTGYRSLCAVSYDPKGKYLAMDTSLHPMGDRYWLVDFIDHGHNFRMIDMQAAVGRVQLQKVMNWNIRRGEIAKNLYNGLVNMHQGLIVPEINNNQVQHHSWHIFHILVTETFPLPKEQFMWALIKEFGIKTWNHYSPMHLSSAFRSQGLGKLGDCPVAEALFEQFVSLPIHPRLTDEAVVYMINAIKQISLRTYVKRETSSPLINEILAFSTPKMVQNSDYTSDIVDSQLKLFKPQIEYAINDGFFYKCSEINLINNNNHNNNHPIYISRAPGRLDLMGGNDDYTGGLVFECTIAEATFAAVQVRPYDCYINVRNRQLCNEDIRVPISMLTEVGLTPIKLAKSLKDMFPNTRWPLYVIGVFLWLQMKYPQQLFTNGQQGLSLLIWGQIPLNRGVSSSASVEVTVMKAVAFAYGIALSGETLATACQWIENQVCSSACGLMDQMAVTLGDPFMAMQCQPAVIYKAPPLPDELTIFALDSGVSREISGIEYESARVAAFMGYKIICTIEGLDIIEDNHSEIPRYKDSKYNGYLANIAPSVYTRQFESLLPIAITGQEFIDLYGNHVDPATSILPEYIYHIRANTKYAIFENNRVTLFQQLLKSYDSNVNNNSMYIQLGELMYQSHDSYTECGLGSQATTKIVELVQQLGTNSGLFGAKITGGGAGGTVCILGLHKAKDIFYKEIVEVYTRYRGLLENPPYVFVGSSIGADVFGIREF